jgi:hypothetical protein
MMAAAEAKRNVIYYTFSDEKTVKKLKKILAIVDEKNLSVSDLYKLLDRYCEFVKENAKKRPVLSLHEFLANNCQ